MFFAGLVAVLLVGISPSAHAAKYKIRWLLGHQNLDYFEDAALEFKHTVEAKSHGDIQIDIVKTDEYLGNREPQAPRSSEIEAAVAGGEAEMGHSFTDIIGGVDHRLYAFEAPYLFRDYRHLEGVFEGPLGSELLDGLSAKHIVGLSFTYSGGANGIATIDREIKRPEDLKGLKVGVYGDEVNEAWLKSLGATPVKIGHKEETILSRAAEGSLDAVVITWRNFERAGLDQKFKYFNLADSSYLVSVTYVNDKFFASLPEAYQKLLREASHETGRIERAKTIALNALMKRKVEGYGVQQVYLPENGSLRFVEAVRTAYRGSIEGLVGKDLLERMRKTGDGPGFPPMPGDVAVR